MFVHSGSTEKLFAYSGLSGDIVGGAPGPGHPAAGASDSDRISSGGFYGGPGTGGGGGRPRAPTETGSMLEESSLNSYRPGPGGASGGSGGGGGGIVDVIVVHGSDGVPAGYSKLERSSGGRRADLNTGARGQYLYLAVGVGVGLFVAGRWFDAVYQRGGGGAVEH